jgi:hypothetical protein
VHVHVLVLVLLLVTASVLMFLAIKPPGMAVLGG